jgi:hypothetical protein
MFEDKGTEVTSKQRLEFSDTVSTEPAERARTAALPEEGKMSWRT